jgi:beta-lactamase class A
MLFGVPALLAAPATAREAALPPITAYEQQSGGHIGVYAENLATGAKFAWRANDRFVMCSTVKASLVALVLTRIDRGHDALDQMIPYTAADIGDLYAPAAKANLAKGALSVQDMCKAAIELSDGACTNLLLRRVGGPPAMTAFWRSIGDGVTRLDHDEPVLNRTPPGGVQDTTTPAAMAANLQKFVLGTVLAEQSRARLKSWLIGCQTGGDRLRAGLPANWVTGDKTGHNDKDAAADIAITWPTPGTPIVICAYTRGGTPTDDQFNAAFAGTARLLASKLV